MRIGIVGSEAAKFTPNTERLVRQQIRALLGPEDVVISGGCHLGGVDLWAVEEAKAMGLEYREYLPRCRQWSGGYKERNLQIVADSDRVICFTVRRLPPTHTGLRFAKCYHCNTDQHVKSGGCWTVKQAILQGKPGAIIVIDDPDTLRRDYDHEETTRAAGVSAEVV